MSNWASHFKCQIGSVTSNVKLGQSLQMSNWVSHFKCQIGSVTSNVKLGQSLQINWVSHFKSNWVSHYKSINQSKFIFFNKHQTYNITKIQNKSQPFTSKVHITVNMRLKSAI